MILEGLCDSVTASMLRGVPILLTALIRYRLQRLLTRFAAAAAWVASGKVARSRTPAPPREGAAGAASSGVGALDAGLRLPVGFGWLIRLTPDAAGLSARFEQLLTTDPEMAALIAASPSVRRILRPLCRMLGIETPSALLLPKRARPARRDAAHALAGAGGPAPTDDALGASLAARPAAPSLPVAPVAPVAPSLPPPAAPPVWREKHRRWMEFGLREVELPLPKFFKRA